VQPEAQFVEIGEELAKEKGIKHGDMVKVKSNRGEIKSLLWSVTKRIKGLDCQRQEGSHGRHSDPLGLQGRSTRTATCRIR
jgi:anaerobic selenocysteine-containing dehydrogenase